MKSKREIERVHELLEYVLDSGPVKDHDTLMKLLAARNVLCWALGHTHENPFVEYLSLIEKEIREQGADVKLQNN